MPRKKKSGFKCRICGKSFGMAMHLGRHMASHGQAPGRSVAASPNQTASVGAADQLAALIAKLQSQRQGHEDAIAQIDATFEQFGIGAAPAKKRRGRPRRATRTTTPAKAAKTGKVAKKARRRSRRTFATSGLESILGFVAKAGKKGATTSEIVKHWKSEGRSGDGYTALGALVKQKQLMKEKIEGSKGSRYTAA